jgi:hypothetical protein
MMARPESMVKPIALEVVPAERGQLELGAPGSGDGGSEGHRCRWFDLAVVDRLLDGGQRPAHFVLLQCAPSCLLASPGCIRTLMTASSPSFGE